MKRHAKILLALLVATIGGSVYGQSVLHSLKDGAFFPIVELKGRMPYCVTGYGIEKALKDKVTLLPSEDFVNGFVDVEIIANKRKGIATTSGSSLNRFTSHNSWYSLKCRIVSNADLEDCFYALRFDTFGKSSFYCRSIGDLKAGKSKLIEVFMKINYEMPKQLHIFSGAGELRTTLVPGAYSYENGEFLCSVDK